MKGWVYIITNRAQPNIVKIGYSMQDPDLRAQELDSPASPYPHIVEYKVFVEEAYSTEQRVHELLESKWVGKEWFRCSIQEAIEIIKKVAVEPVGIADLPTGDWYIKGLKLGMLDTKYEEALLCFNKHLELKPDDEDAQYWKSICLHALKRYEEALDCISRVRYHIADSYYLRAICLRDKGEEKKIVVYWFRKYLTALPSNDKRKAEALRFIDEYKKSIGGIRGFFS